MTEYQVSKIRGFANRLSPMTDKVEIADDMGIKDPSLPLSEFVLHDGEGNSIALSGVFEQHTVKVDGKQVSSFDELVYKLWQSLTSQEGPGGTSLLTLIDKDNDEKTYLEFTRLRSRGDQQVETPAADESALIITEHPRVAIQKLLDQITKGQTGQIRNLIHDIERELDSLLEGCPINQCDIELTGTGKQISFESTGQLANFMGEEARKLEKECTGLYIYNPNNGGSTTFKFKK